MKALVLFRSHYGNTKRVADEIAEQVKAAGYEVVVQDLRQPLPDTDDFDFIVIGAPTRMSRVTGQAIGVLKQLQKRQFTDKPLLIFDTYGPLPKTPEEMEKGKKWLFPGAAGRMQKIAGELGLKIYDKTLRCAVAEFKGPLAEGELEKVAPWVKEFLGTAGKKGAG